MLGFSPTFAGHFARLLGDPSHAWVVFPLSRVLPHTSVADWCKIEKTHLDVRGQLGTYRILLGWAAAVLVTDSGIGWLRIPQKILGSVVLDLASIPIELDYRTEMVLRKACVLADHWRIDCPELVRQFMPE
ncbi:MAG: hypothetical protein LAO03_20795 [Acidobacteriia bacterium]|nr:hypothetical protein [Terriglobia bacterium]